MNTINFILQVLVLLSIYFLGYVCLDSTRTLTGNVRKVYFLLGVSSKSICLALTASAMIGVHAGWVVLALAFGIITFLNRHRLATA